MSLKIARAQPDTLDKGPFSEGEIRQQNDHVERRIRQTSSFFILYLLLQAELGLAWDRNWHDYLGRDQFWIPPHILIYTGLGGAGLVALIVVLADSVRFFKGKPGVNETSTVSILGFLHAPLGFIILGYGTFVDFVAAPLDNYWHELYGIDVTLWSPFHVMGTIGGILAGIGTLYIFASQAVVERERRVATLSRRSLVGLTTSQWGALIFFAAFLELSFPALTAFQPFTLGALQFLSYPLPLACAAGLCLVGSIQFTRKPGTATLVVLLFWIEALFTQIFVPWALHAAKFWFGLSFRPGVGVPTFNITLALLPVLLLIDAVIVDGVALWQYRRHRQRDVPLRGSWLLGAFISLPLVFFPVSVVMMLIHATISIPMQKDIILTFFIEPTLSKMLLTVPFTLLSGTGGALWGSALASIWYRSKR